MKQLKTFKCEYCDKDFLTWSHLKRHVQKCRIVKTPRDNKKKSKDIVCKYCDKSFTKNELNSHLKEHIIETFNCDVCSKSVIRAAINHVRSLLFTLPPTNVRQSQMTPIMTPRVTVVTLLNSKDGKTINLSDRQLFSGGKVKHKD